MITSKWYSVDKSKSCDDYIRMVYQSQYHVVSMHQNDQATTCVPNEVPKDSSLIKRLELAYEWDIK